MERVYIYFDPKNYLFEEGHLPEKYNGKFNQCVVTDVTKYKGDDYIEICCALFNDEGKDAV